VVSETLNSLRSDEESEDYSTSFCTSAEVLTTRHQRFQNFLRRQVTLSRSWRRGIVRKHKIQTRMRNLGSMAISLLLSANLCLQEEQKADLVQRIASPVNSLPRKSLFAPFRARLGIFCSGLIGQSQFSAFFMKEKVSVRTQRASASRFSVPGGSFRLKNNRWHIIGKRSRISRGNRGAFFSFAILAAFSLFMEV